VTAESDTRHAVVGLSSVQHRSRCDRCDPIRVQLLYDLKSVVPNIAASELYVLIQHQYNNDAISLQLRLHRSSR